MQRPAAAFVSDMYAHAVNGRSKGYVLFLAGGGGAGKTVVAERFVDDPALLIYDTTFSHAQGAFTNVRLALDNGRSVVIVYVYRPFENAVRGVIARAVQTGRTVPLHVLAKDHVEAPKTVLEVARRYPQNNDVNVYVVDNSGNDPVEIEVINDSAEALHFLENIAYE